MALWKYVFIVDKTIMIVIKKHIWSIYRNSAKSDIEYKEVWEVLTTFLFQIEGLLNILVWLVTIVAWEFILRSALGDYSRSLFTSISRGFERNN